ncbi:hypothetical protein JXO52_09475 [bacterium]|nr:hypothetical protein [bacterium]
MQRVMISPVDTHFVNGSYPIEFLLYYPGRIDTDRLRSALQRVSEIFWPLCGIYDKSAIRSLAYSESDLISFSDNDGAFAAEADDTAVLKAYQHVAPHPMPRLFHLSVLQFSNGTVLIPTLNHLAGDGYSYFLFLSRLAAATADPGRKDGDSPVETERILFNDFRFRSGKIAPPPRDGECTIEVLPVRKALIKQEIRAIRAESGVTVSTNDMLAARVFKELFRKQPDCSFGEYSLTIPIDVRRQVKEMSGAFIGNGLMFHRLTVPAEQLQMSSLDELALMIRESMPEISSDTYRVYLSGLEQRIERSPVHTLTPYDPDRGCLVTNLSLLPAGRLDFGSGRPERICTLTVGRHSAAILGGDEHFIIRLAY